MGETVRPCIHRCFEHCKLKRSVNDEKWRDCFVPCFVAMISAKISASGEVGASQNMEANIQKLKISFRKNKLWSNLEEKSQN